MTEKLAEQMSPDRSPLGPSARSQVEGGVKQKAWLPADGTMPAFSAWAERSPLLSFVDACLRGAGQVIFLNNPVTGLLILIALLIDRSWLGAASAIGLIASTAAAHLLGYERSSIRAGLFGFNGLLIGGALATFLPNAWSPGMIGAIVVLAAGGTLLAAGLGSRMGRVLGLPALTLPFNLITIPILWLSFDVIGLERLPSAAPSAASELTGIFSGIGQLFFAGGAGAGLLILLGIAIASRLAALVALVGSVVGLGLAMFLGLDPAAIEQGLWSYNAYVTAVAIAGVFYVLTWRSALLGVLAAAAALVVQLGLAEVLGGWGLPVLTMPFCLATLAFMLLLRRMKGVRAVPLGEITTPEAHRRVA